MGQDITLTAPLAHTVLWGHLPTPHAQLATTAQPHEPRPFVQLLTVVQLVHLLLVLCV